MELELLKSSAELKLAIDTLTELKNSNNPSAIIQYQNRRLEQTWNNARKSEHYGKLRPFSLQEFFRLPPTPRELLKKDPQSFDAVSWDSVIKYYESSGTSGIATPTMRTAKDVVWNYVSVWLQWSELVGGSDRCLILLPSDIAPIGDLIAGVCALADATAMRCFPFTQGVVSWDRIHALSQRYQPTVLWGSPGTVMQLLRIMKRRGSFAELAAPVKKIMLMGEVVSDRLRHSLAREWDAEVFNASYGSTETGTIAAVGRSGLLRMLPYSFFCEIDIGGAIVPVAPGLAGELIITTLNAIARPLIRFATGNMVRVHASADGAGMDLTVLGRAEEEVVVGNKPYRIFDLEEIFYGIQGVTGYQVRRRDNEVTAVSLESDPDYAADLDDLRDRALAHLREAGFEIELSIVEELPLTTKSGAGLKSWKRSNVTAH